MPKPIIKWVGGKSKIAKQIVSHFPPDIQTYHEPFVGGGSVLLELLHAVRVGKIKVNNVYASDNNIDLINMYIQVQRYPFEVLRIVNTLQNQWDSIEFVNGNQFPMNQEEAQSSKESFYYWIRSSYNKLEQEERISPLAASYFIFLNKTCERGIYRSNLPFGNYNKVTFLDEDHVRNFHELIQPVLFQVQSYEQALSIVQQGDMVYLDPPKLPKSVHPRRTVFSRKDQVTLLLLCNGYRWVWSYSEYAPCQDGTLVQVQKEEWVCIKNT